MPHLVVMAAGTGGHIIPGLAVAKEMLGRGWSVSWLGTSHGMENLLVPKSGITLDTIAFSGLRGKGLLHTMTGGLRLLKAFWDCLSIAMRVGGTSLFSMPVVVPSQLTVQPRRCSSRATAMPGMMCPPVPAAMITRWGITSVPHASAAGSRCRRGPPSPARSGSSGWPSRRSSAAAASGPWWAARPG